MTMLEIKVRKYRIINTKKDKIFCQGSETAFDGARKYHCLQKDC